MMMKVPQRKYGSLDNNNNLPAHVPLIGLGCSSFSTFFSSNNYKSDEKTLTLEDITRDHPTVVGWIETVRHAVLNRGINLLDTAPWYGHGISEVVIGYALDTILTDDENDDSDAAAANNTATETATTQKIVQSTRKRHGTLPRSALIINTKIGRYESNPLHQFDFSYDTTIQSAQRSLQRMNCTYIDVLQLHDPEFLLGMPNTHNEGKDGGGGGGMEILLKETIPALLECKKRGWIKAIGVTGYPLEVQHEILVQSMKSNGDDNGNGGRGVVFDQSLVYCHCNLHDLSLFQDKFIQMEKEEEENNTATITTKQQSSLSYAQFCKQSKINLMCAAPLSMGLLTHSGPPSWHPASSYLKGACADAAIICEQQGVDISSLAMVFALSRREVGCTLIGMKNVREVDVASDLAFRFDGIDFDRDGGANDDNDESSSEGDNKSILDSVLSAKEKETLDILMDATNGPFAKVWSSGEYRWDGMEEARKFWALVDEMKRSDGK